MGARRARPRPGHPRPRPRPPPTSPPLPQGWGRPLPGPRGRLGFRAEGPTDPQSAVRRESTFYWKSGRQRRVCGGRALEDDSPGGGGRSGLGGRRHVPGDPMGVKRVRGRRALQPPPSPQPTAPSSPSLAPAAQSEFRTWLGSIAPAVSTACGWTDLGGHREFGCQGVTLLLWSGQRGNSPPSGFRPSPSLHAAKEGQERGSRKRPSPPNTRRLPKLTADGAAESSLLFIRFPSPGKGEAEGIGDGKGERRPLPECPGQPRFIDLCPEAQRWARSRRPQEQVQGVAGGAPRGDREHLPSAECLGEGTGSWRGRDDQRDLGAPYPGTA